MGHVRLGTLPKTQKWRQVVSLIAGGADVERIAAGSANAAENGLERHRMTKVWRTLFGF